MLTFLGHTIGSNNKDNKMLKLFYLITYDFCVRNFLNYYINKMLPAHAERREMLNRSTSQSGEPRTENREP